MMKITLYDHGYESLAIQYLAATLKKNGFNTDIFFDCSMKMDHLDQDLFMTPFFSLKPERVAKMILEKKPDIVGFSILTVFYPEVAKIMRCLKKYNPKLLIIAGGPHCNMVPSHALENDDIDFIFLGDADFSVIKFLKYLDSHSASEIRRFTCEQLPGVANRADGRTILRGLGPVMENLDMAPFPEKGPYYEKNPSLKIVYTTTCSRGCIFTCTYCNSNNLRKVYKDNGQAYYRIRSVKNVIEELKIAKRQYRPKYIMFLDNLFAPDKNWLKEFAESYKKEIDIPFFCETNPNVHTKESVELLHQAGCCLLQFGFQSANEDVRREILHRYETNERIAMLVKHAKELGVLVCTDHIANLPGEKKEHLQEAIKFYKGIKPYWINLGFLQYYPQAEIIEIAIKRHSLNPEAIPSIIKGESQSSFRLLSKSKFGDYYRTLPMRLFSAVKLPDYLDKCVNGVLDNRFLSSIFSKMGSVFLYVSRTLYAFTDKRDFLIRHHVIRNIYVAKIILSEKYLKHERQPENHK